MTRELASRFKARAVLCLLGLAGFAALELLAALGLALSLAAAWQGRQPSLLLFAVAAGGLLTLCSVGLHACLRGRRLLLAFGRWTESAPDAEATQERRALLSGARSAFEEGDCLRAGALLSRYLEARPQDSTARLNLACCLALAGELEGARAALKLSGDPLKLEPSLPVESARWPALSPAELSRASTGLLLPLTAGLGFTAGFLLSGGLAWKAAVSAEEYLEAASPQSFVMNLVKRLGNTAGANFKTAESEHFIYYYHDEEFLRKVIPLAEEALRFNTEFFVLSDSIFSTRKIKLYVMDSQKDFMRFAPAAKGWEAAVTMDEVQEVYIYRMGKGREWYFENTLAHEISHVCYRKILPQIEKGSWLNEGLAEHIGYEFSLGRLGFPKAAWLKANVFKGVAEKALPFEAFLSDNPQVMAEDHQIRQFYDQGYSIVYVLITYYGKDEFLKFLRQYALKRDLGAALREAYPTIKGTQDLQGIWLLFMK